MAARKHRRDGFALAEMVVIVIIAGMLLGFVWTISARVHQQSQVRTTFDQLMLAVTRIRTMYGNSGTIASPSGTDLDATMAQYIFSPDMLRQRKDGNVAGMNLWGDSWRVMVGRGNDEGAKITGGTLSGDQSHFYFYSGDVPPDVCVDLVKELRGANATAILINNPKGWAGWQDPSTITASDFKCWPFGKTGRTAIAVEFALQ